MKTSKAEITARKMEMEKNIKETFAVRSGYWGIDRVILKKITLKSINCSKLTAQMSHKKMKASRIKYSASTRDIEYLLLKDGSDSILEYRKTEYGIVCELTVLYGKINVVTSGVADIHQRVKELVKKYAEQYGITLRTEDAEYKLMEIAYTSIYDGRIPVRSRGMVLNTVAHHTRSIIEVKKSKPRKLEEADVETMYVKNLKARKTGCTYKIYDKTRQLIDIQYLDSNYPYKIYRYEITLENTAMIKQKLGTACYRDISDVQVCDYIYNIVNEMFWGMLQDIKKSAEAARQLVKELPLDRKSGCYEKMITDILAKEIDYRQIKIRDEETFLHMCLGGDNGKRTELRLLSACERVNSDKTGMDRNPLSRLDGWIAEDYMNELLDAHAYAKEFGLGIKPVKTAEAPRIEHLLYGEFAEKEKILHELNRGKNARYKYIKRLLGDR